ncbi:MAG: hypothetical protein HQ464_03120, partial [Planctomycetes bacterium]|nr:hypothetical protein [Planctomycetota bacterium]
MKPHSYAVAIGLLFMPIGGWATASEPGQPQSAQPHAVKSIHAMAEPLPAIPGAARPSAVCIRSLTAHPAHKTDPHDTLAAIRGFHATRLEWTYGDNPEFIKKVHALNVEYGGA